MEFLSEDNLKLLIENTLNRINSFATHLNFQYISLGMTVALLILYILYRWQRNKAYFFERYSHFTDGLIMNLAASKSLDHSLDNVLSVVSKIIQVQSYSFYLLDSKSGAYLLKAVRHANVGDGQIAPSYSGLLPFRKETFLPPMSIMPDPVPTKTSFVKEGTVPLLMIPFKGFQGLICAGPISRIPKRTRYILDIAGEKLTPFMEIVMEIDRLKGQVGTVVASHNAMQSISNMITNDHAMVHTLLGICIRTTGALGGFFIRKESESFHVLSALGMDGSIETALHQDHPTQTFLYSFTIEHDYFLLHKGQKEFYQLPSYFAVLGAELFLLINVRTEHTEGFACFWYSGDSQVEEYRITALMLLSRRIGDLLDNHVKVKELTGSYMDMLKILANMMDNLSPFTVGYSELMYRYSVIIARELKLEKSDLEDIGLAAYLSNIGILGMSDDLFNKRGKYSEKEYEMMKLHSEVGASLIEAVTGNSRVASYVRYHHERMDGFGYPEGKKGSDIPLGARIIAVVQTFLAKINGRSDRDALPFEKALELLRSASGSQLESSAVDALVGWFEKKQANQARNNRSLGPCWEMRCSPESICNQCPAYRKTEVNCWENKGINCVEHGNKCETCSIYTEYQYRLKKFINT